MVIACWICCYLQKLVPINSFPRLFKTQLYQVSPRIKLAKTSIPCIICHFHKGCDRIPTPSRVCSGDASSHILIFLSAKMEHHLQEAFKAFLLQKQNSAMITRFCEHDWIKFHRVNHDPKNSAMVSEEDSELRE